MRFLVVEDEDVLRDLCRHHLQGNFQGAAVDMAEDGEEAIEKLERNSYDVVVLDISLPKKDGVEVMGAIVQAPTCQNTRVVLMSSIDPDTEKWKAMFVPEELARISQALPKPFGLDTLLQAVQKALEDSKSR